MERPVIFVSGIDFVNSKGGLAVRTSLMAKMIEDIFPARERVMVLAEGDQHTIDTLTSRGWRVIMAGARDGSLGYKLTRMRRILLARLGIDPAGDMLWLRGGSIQVDSAVINRLSKQYPTGIFWIYRTDYAGMVRFRRPGQKWFIDTNDSVFHLEQAYGWSNVVARQLRWDSAHLAACLRKEEAKFLPRFDQVIAIAPKDFSHFGAFVPAERLCMYDTCIVLDEAASAGDRPYFAGYLGGDHKGSIECVRALVKIFESELFAPYSLIVGGTCSAHVSSDRPNIKIVGPVPDSRAFWRSVANVILPGVQPTGISVKFQEALASRCRLFISPNGYTWSKFPNGQALVEYIDNADLKTKLAEPPRVVPESFYQAIAFPAIRSDVQGLLRRGGLES